MTLYISLREDRPTLVVIFGKQSDTEDGFVEDCDGAERCEMKSGWWSVCIQMVIGPTVATLKTTNENISDEPQWEIRFEKESYGISQLTTLIFIKVSTNICDLHLK